jgi:hypothetical protein
MILISRWWLVGSTRWKMDSYLTDWVGLSWKWSIPKLCCLHLARLRFTRDAWRKAGGYPEWLSLTGEDTYFAAELKRCCPHWAFVPDAVVDWPAPANPVEYWRKIYNWSIGDGESGAFTQWYWWSLVRVGSVALSYPASSIGCPGGLAGWTDAPGHQLCLIVFAFFSAFMFVYTGDVPAAPQA